MSLGCHSLIILWFLISAYIFIGRKYYKYILTRNFEALNAKGGKNNQVHLDIFYDFSSQFNFIFQVKSVQ